MESLGILPDCYLHTPVATAVMSTQAFDLPSINATSVNTTTSLLTKNSVVTEFPMVFDGIIRAMDGEQFHIHLSQQLMLSYSVSHHPEPSPLHIVISWPQNLTYYNNKTPLLQSLNQMTGVLPL